MKKKLMISLLALTSLGAGAQNLQKGDYGYLYCHMSGRGEWTAYALSRDGVHFHDLIDGDPVYNVEEMSKIEGGARDAFICRTSDGKGYLMVTTDMSNAKSRSWFNYGINLLKSDDLIHWTSTTFDFRQGPGIFCESQSPDVYKDYSTIKRVWAPQIFWDPTYVWDDGTKGGYMIYYSLLNPAEDQYDRVFYSYADATFTRLTKPRLLVDWGYATIDADINYVPADGLYHMLIKKEGGTPGIFAATDEGMVLFAVGSHAPYYKAKLDSGLASEHTIRIGITVSSEAVVEMRVSSAVYVTREELEALREELLAGMAAASGLHAAVAGLQEQVARLASRLTACQIGQARGIATPAAPSDSGTLDPAGETIAPGVTVAPLTLVTAGGHAPRRAALAVLLEEIQPSTTE